MVRERRELGIGIVPYGALRREFFSGKASVEALDDPDSRKLKYPSFSGDNFDKNMVLYQRVKTLAEKHRCTPGELALSWLSNQGDDVAPIPGTTKIDNLDENLESVNVKLGPQELDEVSAAIPRADVAGDRYGVTWMTFTWKSGVTPHMESWTAKS